MCAKACPSDAVTLEDNLVHIDHKKCMDYGPECGEVCVEKCPRNIFRHYSRKPAAAKDLEAAVG
jgi:electron transport complex protein RnfB